MKILKKINILILIYLELFFLFSFTNQKSTKLLQKSLVGISKDIIDYVIYELTGLDILV